MKPLLITRPEPGLTASCSAARDAGLDPVAAPLFTVIPVPWTLPKGCDSLLIGSANILRHGGEQLAMLTGLPAYCVGAKTAEAARESGFTPAFTGENGLEDCVDALVRDGHAHALRLTGSTHTALEPRNGLSISTAICYETRVQYLPESAIDALDSPSVIMAYSGAAVEAVEAEMLRLGLTASSHMLLAISQRAADSAAAPWHDVQIAHRPDDAAMLAQARILCQRD
ncbi:MAG: uroporphyrinogen-III synthase [Pseudomonadota bacterium]